MATKQSPKRATQGLGKRFTRSRRHALTKRALRRVERVLRQESKSLCQEDASE
jgi:hypothetical protein